MAALNLCAQTINPDGVEFFERRIRPVLADKCYGCHNSKMATPLGGLRLDTREGLARGGAGGKIVEPGDPGASRLVQALSHRAGIKMPPTGKLPDAQIADFEAWIKMGAPDPRTGRSVTNAAQNGWAFQPVKRPPVPEVRKRGWVQSPVDAFVLARLEKERLAPAPPADRRSLLRRVTFDLIGLPPTIQEMDDFLADTSPGAYAKVVERLLASPHYGERWARHWLDLVRYAETNGHEYDNDKQDPWRYRDYVIRAFNSDLPYNQFVQEHIAGDLPGFRRLRAGGTMWDSPLATTSYWFNEVLNSATDSEKSRADDVDNQIDVFGKTFLGLTVACARCHDHKFDPIPTADYYALAGVLHSTDLREAALDSPDQMAQLRDLSAKILRIKRQLGSTPQPPQATIEYRPEDKIYERFDGRDFGAWVPQGVAFGAQPQSGAADSRAAGSDVFVGTLTSPKFRTGKELYLHVRIAGTKGADKLKERGPLRFTIVADGYKGQHIISGGSDTPEWKTLTLTFERERTCYFEIVDRSRDGHIVVDEIVFSSSKQPPPTSGEDVPPAEPLQSAEIAQLEAQVPESEFAMVAEDRDCRDVRLHLRGSHQNLGDPVPRRFLQAIAGESQPPIKSGSGRAYIAGWMSSDKNPLTARVMVNRLWKHHFGQGLVRSIDNFGRMGEPPTHPELLDYLASEFMAGGWSVKNLHRRMVLSSAYQMSSEASPESARIDPANKLLQHMSVRRLEAEAIRDSILAVSGNLNSALYGPSIPPHISEYQNGRGRPQSGALDGDGRRSIYIQVRRNFMTPMFVAFDYPSPISTIGARTVSTVPSQALMMMNNEFVASQASLWAARVSTSTATPPDRIRSMYLEAFGRPAKAAEIAKIESFVASQGERAETGVWADVAHVLLNSAEFLFVR